MTFQRCKQDMEKEFMPGLGDYCKGIQLAGETLPEICMSNIEYVDCSESNN